MTKLDNLDKTWQKWQNIIECDKNDKCEKNNTRVTKLDIFDKTWRTCQNVKKFDKIWNKWKSEDIRQKLQNVTKCDKYGKTGQVWQNLVSLTKYDKYRKSY